MIVFCYKIGLMKCAGEGTSASLSVYGRSLSCMYKNSGLEVVMHVREQRPGNSQRRTKNKRYICIGYRRCKFQDNLVLTVFFSVTYVKVTSVRPYDCERELVLLKNDEFKCMVTVFVDCLCFVRPLVVCVAGKMGGVYRTVISAFLVKNTGVNNVGIDESTTQK